MSAIIIIMHEWREREEKRRREEEEERRAIPIVLANIEHLTKTTHGPGQEEGSPQ